MLARVEQNSEWEPGSYNYVTASCIFVNFLSTNNSSVSHKNSCGNRQINIL